MRALALVLLAVLVTPLGAPRASAQAETIEFRLKLAKGEALFHSLNTAVALGLEMLGSKQALQGQETGRLAVRVLDVEEDGTMLVEGMTEDVSRTIGTSTERPLDEPWSYRVRPDGTVVETLAGEKTDNFPFKFPGRPVAVGETWSGETTISESGIKGRVTRTYTLAAVERVNDERVARVTAKDDGKVTGTSYLEARPGTTTTTGTVKGTGEMIWSVDRGRMLRSSDDLEVVSESYTFTSGVSIRIILTVKTSTRREPIAAAPPDPVPDFQLIAPGQGVSGFLVTLPVAEVTGILGQPGQGQNDWGLRATALLWQTGLVGYVDPSDSTNLVGLQVRDRDLRTEKGIGFGASQGAAMIAYGLAPTRVSLKSPRGSVRVLIYNDLGIAFGITADKTYAGQKGTAPIGLVDWITIFPPGGAGKIFPLP